MSVFVEAEGHDSVGQVEGLLDPVPVVDVNINVKNTRKTLQKLVNG